MLSIDRETFESTSLAIRKRIVEIGLNSPYKSAHFGGALSSVEIVLYLFSSFLRLEKKSSKDLGRDRFAIHVNLLYLMFSALSFPQTCLL